MQNYKLWYDVNENIARSIEMIKDSFIAIQCMGSGNLEKDDQFVIFTHILTLDGICHNTILDLQRLEDFNTHKNYDKLMDLATSLKSINFKHVNIPSGEKYSTSDLVDVSENCLRMSVIIMEMLELNDEIK